MPVIVEEDGAVVVEQCATGRKKTAEIVCQLTWSRMQAYEGSHDTCVEHQSIVDENKQAQEHPAKDYYRGRGNAALVLLRGSGADEGALTCSPNSRGE